jgi:hypothetical protein
MKLLKLLRQKLHDLLSPPKPKDLRYFLVDDSTGVNIAVLDGFNLVEDREQIEVSSQTLFTDGPLDWDSAEYSIMCEDQPLCSGLQAAECESHSTMNTGDTVCYHNIVFAKAKEPF